MVDLKTAYKIAYDFFLENEYAGIHEIRENNNNWMFKGKCEKVSYGTSEVCIPKNGDEPYLFSLSDIDNLIMWKDAKVVSL